MIKLSKLGSILLLIIFSVKPVWVYSQNSISVGAFSGLNANFYNGSGVKSSVTGYGLVLGGGVDWSLTSNFGLLGSLLYDNRSSSFNSVGIDQSGNLQDFQNDISLAYITFDALFNYRILSTGFSVHAGPSLGFPIHGINEQTTVTTSDRIDTGITTTNITKTTKEDIKNLSTRFELKLGLGYDIPVSKTFCLSVQTSFGWGLSNVKEGFSWKISSIQALLGVKYDLSGKGFR